MNHSEFGSAIMRGEIYDTAGIKMSPLFRTPSDVAHLRLRLRHVTIKGR